MLRTLALVLSAALVPAAVQSQAAAVEFDHATGAARLIVAKGGGADTTILGRSPIVRLDRSVPVVIRVVNTNTAFYRISEESETAPLPELESFRAFMGRFTPYLPELRAS